MVPDRPTHTESRRDQSLDGGEVTAFEGAAAGDTGLGNEPSTSER